MSPSNQSGGDSRFADSTNGYISDFSVYTGKEEVVEKDLGKKGFKKKRKKNHSPEVNTTSSLITISRL